MASDSQQQPTIPGSLAADGTDGVIEVTVWDLEMTDPGMLRPGRDPEVAVSLLVAERPAPHLSKWLYGLVGADWYWVDRLVWSDEQWLEWVDRPEHHLVTAWVDGVPAGYFELEQQSAATVELAYFGLTPGFIGQGIGGWLLTKAVQRAWSIEGIERVWLHTCSLDGPNAVANYEARGFVSTGEQTEWRFDPESAS